VCIGACGHVLSCQALNAIASRGPGSVGAYPVLKAPGRVLSRGGGGLRQNRLIGGKIMLIHGYRDGGWKVLM
jgi:hypothetical protein